jgi:Tol biopolymer transport system component
MSESYYIAFALWRIFLAFVMLGSFRSKGRSGWAGFFLGLFFGEIVLFIDMFSPSNQAKVNQKQFKQNKTVQCPNCKELVNIDAITCEHCHQPLVSEENEKTTLTNNSISTNQAKLDQQRFDRGELEQCPQCKELVELGASTCKHCHRPLTPSQIIENTTPLDASTLAFLDKAEQALIFGDRRATGILIKQVLIKDFTNDRAWRILHHLLDGHQVFEVFQYKFAQKNYPDKVHMLIAVPVWICEIETNDLTQHIVAKNHQQINKERSLIKGSPNSLSTQTHHLPVSIGQKPSAKAKPSKLTINKTQATNSKYLSTFVVFLIICLILIIYYLASAWPNKSVGLPSSLVIPSNVETTEKIGTTYVDNGKKKIAFTTDRDGNDEIYVMDIDGSNQHNLTNNPASDFGPSWSPDGNRIFFTSDRSGKYDIYVMNADGSNQVNFTLNHPADWHGGTWSPDGTKIMFVSNGEIYVMDSNGSTPVNLTNNPAEDRSPAWSPDGTRIAFVSFRAGTNSGGDIYIMNVDGTNPVNITCPSKDAEIYSRCFRHQGEADPSWSPDGKKIAFTTSRDSTDNKPIIEIYTMNFDGSNAVRLTHFNYLVSYPIWSPNGNKIAFMLSPDQAKFDIFVMNADGSSQTNLTMSPTGNDIGFAWQPSGEIPSPSAPIETPQTPSQVHLHNPVGFIQDYYNYINVRDYSSAWSCLSANFIESMSNKIGHSFDFANDYAAYWNTVDKIEILEASTERVDAQSAIVLLKLRYRMFNGIASVYNHRFHLVKNLDATSWLINSTETWK